MNFGVIALACLNCWTEGGGDGYYDRETSKVSILRGKNTAPIR